LIVAANVTYKGLIFFWITRRVGGIFFPVIKKTKTKTKMVFFKARYNGNYLTSIMKVMRKKWCVLGERGQNLDCEYELKEEM
jgi:hypothetical protein